MPARYEDPVETEAQKRILISYRREDCQPQANGLDDGLRQRLKNAEVFIETEPDATDTGHCYWRRHKRIRTWESNWGLVCTCER